MNIVSRIRVRIASVAAFLACGWCMTQEVAAQVTVVGSRVHVVGEGLEALNFELHAVNDEVLLYAGGPAELLLLDVRPRGVPPRVDLRAGPRATLRVRDLSLYDGPPGEHEVYIDGERYEEETTQPIPDSQSWEAVLTALVPTDFYLDIENGEGTFDLTDMHVRNLHILAHLAPIQVEFSRPNIGVLERFQLALEGGRVEFRDFLNARPRSVTVQTKESECDIQITGKPFEGEAEIYFTGNPKRMRFEVSRKIGVRIEGPATTVAKFDHKHMERRGLALYSKGYDTQKCRVLLHFGSPVEDLEVDWD